MKKFLASIVLAIFSLNSFAGSLYNNYTGESIWFTLNSKNQELQITSSSKNVTSKTMLLSKIESESSGDILKNSSKVMNDGCNKKNSEKSDCIARLLLMPFVSIPLHVAATFDFLLFPITVPRKISNSIKFSRDRSKLMKAITTNSEVKVSDDRFQRICKMLNVTKKGLN